MKKKLIILIFVCFAMTGCGNKKELENKLSESEIKNKLEVKTDERTFTVEEVTYASEKITLNETTMKVKGNEVILGNHTIKTEGEEYKQITAHYEQSDATTQIYALSENEDGVTTIWQTSIMDGESYETIKWEKSSITDATDLILVECDEFFDLVGQTPISHQVYALVKNEVVLVNRKR